METLAYMTQNWPFAVMWPGISTTTWSSRSGGHDGSGTTASHTSLNVVGVSVKCHVRSSSVSFSFTMLDIVDGPSSIVFVFYSVFMGTCGNFRNVALMLGKKNSHHGKFLSGLSFICGVHVFAWPGSFLLQSVETLVCGSMLEELPTCPGRNWITFMTRSIYTPAHSKAIASNFLKVLVRIFSWKLSCSAAGYVHLNELIAWT